MKSHWQTTKFLPFQKLLSAKQLNSFSYYYHKLVSKFIETYEPEKPIVMFSQTKTNSVSNDLSNIFGFNSKKFDISRDINKSFGNYLADLDGNLYLDLEMNNGLNVLGYNHRYARRVVNLEVFQMYSISNYFSSASTQYPALMRQLNKLSPKGLEEIFLCKNYQYSIENAIRYACLSYLSHNKNSKSKSLQIITFEGGKYQENSIVLPFPVIKHPYSEHRESNLEEEQIAIKNLEELLNDLSNNPNTCVPALVIEPIQFSAGIRYASPQFYRKIMKICKDNGINVILDEHYTCGWVTGRMFSYLSWCSEITPDIVVFGGRMQISGFFYRRGLIESLDSLKEAGINFNINSSVNLLKVKQLHLIHKMVYDTDWLDLHSNNFYSSVMTEFSEIQQYCKFKILNVRGQGKLIAFDVEHKILRDEILDLALQKGIKLNKHGDNTILLTPCLLFTEIHFTFVKEFLKSVVPTTQYMSKI